MKINRYSLHGVFKGVVLGAAALAIAFAGVSASSPVRSVERVDAARYAGTWYELARLPNRFQNSCISDVTASYRPLPDGSLEVVNRCREANQRWSEVEGRAKPADDSGSNARLQVSFLPTWLQWLPVGRGDYWVVMLDADYRYAVVSEPSRKYMWLLSRTPTMDPITYDRIVETLRAQGYPTDKLLRTPHRIAPEALTVPRLLV